VSGLLLGEDFLGVEAPGDGDGSDSCFVSCFDVAGFVSNVDDFRRGEGEGLANGAEVLCFAREFG